MIDSREQIGDKIFIAQTTFYIYENEEHLQSDRPAFCTTSDKEVFESHKSRLKKELGIQEDVIEPEINEPEFPHDVWTHEGMTRWCKICGSSANRKGECIHPKCKNYKE